ncbi:hypothetical protein CBS147333_9660 [Penicillium roqueforti]|nr:hypothetical protein CBS147333_9660 [Penicillium roqueforti]KAI3194110.1 hypothetical protein CBS147311_8810 [Penicillium roqueforti]KAI3261806.1 hypothetical protein CBS147308_9594 [Penicillium roqueforti]KAI3279556.1 hypothetical protein DTO003C3_9668 [Penicillium roqueforti]KAI3288385.1 hypothetical protein DTO002I6_7333 [Penicillium roqueforti]
MSNIEEILEATDLLTSLSVINAQELLPYQRRLEGALQILQRSVEAARALQSQLLEPDCTPFTSSSSPPLPESISGGENQDVSRKRAHLSRTDQQTTHNTEPDSHSNRKKRRQSGVLGLSLILNDEKKSTKILDYLSPSGYNPIDGGNFDWTEEDPRVVDLRLGSSPNQSFDVKFRRGLSQRSLATEYDGWEKENFHTSRIYDLAQDPSTSDDRKGHMEQFLEVNAHRFQDRNTTLHGLKHGIRLLVFESICGYAGVSSILMLVYSAFRSVKYLDFHPLKEYFKSSAWCSLASEKSSWLVQCQERYDEKIRLWQEHQAEWRATCEGRKRQRIEMTPSTRPLPAISDSRPPGPGPMAMNDQYQPEGRVGIVRQTMSPVTLPLEPSPSFTDHQSPLHFRRAVIGSFERNVPASSENRGSATGEMPNNSTAICGEVILPPIGMTDVANGLHDHLTTGDGSLEPHSQYNPSNQRFVGDYPSQSRNRPQNVESLTWRQPSQYSMAGQGAQYAGGGEPQVVDTSLCSHNMLSSLLFEGQEGPYNDVEPQRIDTSLRSHYMLHDLLDQFEQSGQQPASDVPYQTGFTV